MSESVYAADQICSRLQLPFASYVQIREGEPRGDGIMYIDVRSFIVLSAVIPRVAFDKTDGEIIASLSAFPLVTFVRSAKLGENVEISVIKNILWN